MDENQARSNFDAESSRSSIFQQFADLWLAQSSYELVEATRCAALPHVLSPALFAILCGSLSDPDSLLAQLERASLIRLESAASYVFQPELRLAILQRWRADDRADYRRVNARGVEYCQERMSRGESEQLELVYFQLGADDQRGVALLTDVFDHAWANRNTSLLERLLRYAEEQAPVLEEDAQIWVRYFRTRLELPNLSIQPRSVALQPFLAEPAPILLQAHAQTLIAVDLIDSQDWIAAFETFDKAAQLFRSLGDSLNVARVLEAQGMAFVQMATRLGGLPEESHTTTGRRLWDGLRSAPFLLYRWCSRRISYLPNFYFGHGYQDWVINRILYEGIDRLQQALHILSTLSSDRHPSIEGAIVDIQIQLADLYHRVGRWSLAEQQFTRLEGVPLVVQDEYRLATLSLVRGRAALERSRLAEAPNYLQQAHAVFLRYGDHISISTAARLRADLAMADSDSEAAIPLYAESITAAVAARDLLAATSMLATIASQDHKGLTQDHQDQIAGIHELMSHKAYITRFPGMFLKRFRQFTIYLIVPLTYLVIGTIVDLLTINIAWVEIAILTRKTFNALLLFAAPLVTLWVFELLYVMVGLFIVRLLPYNRIILAQPTYLVTSPDGVVLRDQRGQTTEMRWDKVQQYLSIERRFDRVLSPLFSHTGLQSDGSRIVIDAVISNYRYLQKDIEHRLQAIGRPFQRTWLDVYILRGRWVILIVVLALTLTVAAATILGKSRGAIQGGQIVELWLTTPVRDFCRWMLNLFPLVSVARLLLNRAKVRSMLGMHPSFDSGWPLWAVLGFFLFVMIVEIGSLIAL